MASRRSSRPYSEPALEEVVDILDENQKVVCQFQSSSALTLGDYGGGGTVGQANIRSLVEMEGEEYDENDDAQGGEDGLPRVLQLDHLGHDQWNEITDKYACAHQQDGAAIQACRQDIIIVSGSYGYNQAFLRVGSPRMDALANGLADYSLIDEEEHSEVETEWFNEAFNDMGNHEWRQLKLPPWLDNVRENELAPDVMAELTADVRELAEQHSHTEHAGTYIDWGRVGERLKEQGYDSYLRPTAAWFINQLSVAVTMLTLPGMRISSREENSLNNVMYALQEYADADISEYEEFMRARTIPHEDRCPVHASQALGVPVDLEDLPTCRCGSDDWSDLCDQLLVYFREIGNREYFVAFVRRIGEVLGVHFPMLSDELKGYDS